MLTPTSSSFPGQNSTFSLFSKGNDNRSRSWETEWGMISRRYPRFLGSCQVCNRRAKWSTKRCPLSLSSWDCRTSLLPSLPPSFLTADFQDQLQRPKSCFSWKYWRTSLRTSPWLKCTISTGSLPLEPSSLSYLSGVSVLM